MITKTYKNYLLICDCCLESYEKEFNTWQDAVDGKKESGFISKFSDGRMEDICPECIEG